MKGRMVLAIIIAILALGLTIWCFILLISLFKKVSNDNEVLSRVRTFQKAGLCLREKVYLR